jgi:hypothetical protein
MWKHGIRTFPLQRRRARGGRSTSDREVSMAKLKLNLDQLTVDSFDTADAAAEKGTVFGEQCTCYTNCTCPGCPSCVATCDASCNGTCAGQHTCDYTCDHTCAYGCGWTGPDGHTCDYSASPHACCPL